MAKGKTVSKKPVPAKTASKKSPPKPTKKALPAKKAASAKKAAPAKKPAPRAPARASAPKAAAAVEPVAGALTTLTRLAAKYPALTPTETEAFVSLCSDALADELGRRTRARDVRDDAVRWAIIMDGALTTYPGALTGYAAKRFSYYLATAKALSEQIEHETDKLAHLGSVRGAAEITHAKAIAAREEAIERLTTFAGGRPAERTDVEQAAGTPDDLIRSLRNLARLEVEWSELFDPTSKVLAAAAGLSFDRAVELRGIAAALGAKSSDAKLEGRVNANDSAAVNRIEGRLLFEMREARRIFNAASERNGVVPKLQPSLATRAGVGLKHVKATPAAKANQTPPAQPAPPPLAPN
jgi:hypothetical protein